jgi:hypothetical protein
LEAAPAWTLQHHKHLAWDFLGNLFSFGRGLRADRRWANQTAERLGLTHLVSDHRYGLKVDAGKDGVVSVLVLHQAVPALPGLWRWPRWMEAASWLLWPLFRRRMRDFDEVWIPDHAEKARALAPALSHFGGLRNLGLPVRYLGWQSRWSGFGVGLPQTNGEALLVVLSGPEPARSLWEANLLQQWQDWATQEDLDGPASFWMVRGLPSHFGRPSHFGSYSQFWVLEFPGRCHAGDLDGGSGLDHQPPGLFQPHGLRGLEPKPRQARFAYLFGAGRGSQRTGLFGPQTG